MSETDQKQTAALEIEDEIQGDPWLGKIAAQMAVKVELVTDSAAETVRGSAESFLDYFNANRGRIAAIGGGILSAAAGFAIRGAVVAHHNRHRLAN